MSNLLDGKTSVVTGGASGNGRTIATTFAEHGADVVVADVREEPRLDGRPTHELIDDETDASAAFVDCDVRDRAELEDAVAAADELGGIDVMVNNAGVLHLYDFLDSGDDDYAHVMDINARGTYLGSQVAALEMLENGGGSIINLSSIRAEVGNGEYVSYCTSKGAVRTMTYALADVLGPEIRVNAIQPGTIETAQTKLDADTATAEGSRKRREGIPLDRLGQPEDVAKAAVFFASELASYVTGESLLVDGGLINTSSV